MLTVLAQSDSYEVLHDQGLYAGSVLDNDSHSELEQLIATLVDGPEHGTLNFGSNGYFTYTPDEHFTGTDSFTYSASFGSESDQATATINVTNNAPVPYNGSESVLHDQTLSSYIYSYDLDGDNVTYGLTAGPYQGTLNLYSSGSFTYTPNAAYVGVENFTFTVSDGVATVTGSFAIGVTNTDPEADDGFADINRNSPYSSTVYAYDLDGDSLTYSITGQPLYGTLTLGSGGSFTYTPNGNYGGPDLFVFSVTDGVAADTGTFNINVANTAPSADDGYGEVDQDQTLSSSVYAYDLEGDSLSYAIVSSPAHGSVSMSATGGSFTYTPMTGYVGPDSFTFSATDGLLADTGTFYINVNSNETTCGGSCGANGRYTVHAVHDGDETGLRPAGFTIIDGEGVKPHARRVDFDLGGDAVLDTDYHLADAFGNLWALGIDDYIEIPANANSVSFLAVPMWDDLDNEGDEDVTVTLDMGFQNGNPDTATTTIHDAAVTITATKAQVNENNSGTFSFVIKRWGDTSSAQTVNFAISGTAIPNLVQPQYAHSPTDYTLWPSYLGGNNMPTSVVIPEGAATKTLTFTVHDDGLKEVPQEETVVVTLAAGSGYEVHPAQNSATTTIVDDDETPIISIDPVSTTINEDPGDAAEVTVSRSGSTEFPLTISLAVSGSAERGADYVLELLNNGSWIELGGGSLVLHAGFASRSLRVKPIHDGGLEQPDETVVLQVADGGSLYQASSTNGTGTVTIDDNDSPSAGWYCDVCPSTPAPDYTEWELKQSQQGYFYERQKVVGTWEKKGLEFHFGAAPDPRTVTANFSWSNSTAITVGGEFGAGVNQTLIKDWLEITANFSGNASYTAQQSQESSGEEPIHLLAGQEAEARPMVLVLRTVRQVANVSSASVPAPPEGDAGESAVDSQTADVFEYTWLLTTWTTQTLDAKHTIVVWKTVVP